MQFRVFTRNSGNESKWHCFRGALCTYAVLGCHSEDAHSSSMKVETVCSIEMSVNVFVC